MLRSVSPLLFAVSATLCSATVCAADGAYGRIGGDGALQLDVGGGLDDGRVSAVGGLAVRYLQTAGAYSTWVLRPREDEGQPWTASFGVELRPLFLPRFLKNMETGPATMDLMIDSLSLRLGVVTGSADSLGHDTLGFEAALGFGVPLCSEATGLWLSTAGTMRWSHARMGGSSSTHEPAFLWTLTLGWQQIFRLGLVDAGDAKP